MSFCCTVMWGKKITTSKLENIVFIYNLQTQEKCQHLFHCFHIFFKTHTHNGTATSSAYTHTHSCVTSVLRVLPWMSCTMNECNNPTHLFLLVIYYYSELLHFQITQTSEVLLAFAFPLPHMMSIITVMKNTFRHGPAPDIRFWYLLNLWKQQK